MFKKVLALLMATTMAVGLTACSSGAGTPASEAEKLTESSVATSEVSQEAEGDTSEAVLGGKVGLMISPLAVREEFFRTAELLMEQYGKDNFVMDVYPNDVQNEQEVTISKALNIAMDPDVKAIVFDSADIGTIAAINKIKEERPDIKILMGSLNEDVYEMQKVGDVLLTLDPDQYGAAVAQMAADAGAEAFVFYSFARHMSNTFKIRYRDAMKAVCEENNIKFEEVTMPDPMGDSGVSGAQQFLVENIPAKMDEYGTDNVAFYATVSTVQEVLLKTIIDNHGIYPCHTDPSPFSGFAGALGLEVDDAHKFDAEYVDKLISESLAASDMTGRVGGWNVSLAKCDMQFLFEYALAYANGEVNEQADGGLDADLTDKLIKQAYGENAGYAYYKNDTTGEEYNNWVAIARKLDAF